MKGQFIILHCKVDGMDSPQNIQIYKVSQHSRKRSLTFIINLLTILHIDHLGQGVKLPMIAITYKGSVNHVSLYGAWDGLTSKIKYQYDLGEKCMDGCEIL
jgi:hypothetical protein